VLVSGVVEGERVVTTGFAQLNDGTRITIGTPENLERPAGSERIRRGPITPTPVAQSGEKPPASATAQAQETPRKDDAAAAEKPASSAATAAEPARAETTAATGDKPRAVEAPATNTGERPRGPQRRSESRSPTASP